MPSKFFEKNLVSIFNTTNTRKTKLLMKNLVDSVISCSRMNGMSSNINETIDIHDEARIVIYMTLLQYRVNKDIS